MGSADVLVAILEPDASRFSVPSKVLTYLCSSRAIVAVLPPDNAVAEVLITHNAGRVVGRDEVASAVAQLLDDEEARRALGEAGRRYAEQAFSPETAADRFLDVFGDLVPSVTCEQSVGLSSWPPTATVASTTSRTPHSKSGPLAAVSPSPR